MELHRESERDGTASVPIEIPYRMLSPAALRGVIEDVVLREGTDYGEREHTLERKVGELLRRLRRGDVRIVFDSGSRMVNIQPNDSSLGK